MADLKKILDYLSKLELNNNREWYHNHKQERLEILQEFIQDGEKSVLFSTHITTDLERITDYITYL